MAPGMLRWLRVGIHTSGCLSHLFLVTQSSSDYSSHTSTPGRHYLLPTLLINPIFSKVKFEKERKKKKTSNRFVCVFKWASRCELGARDQEGILTTSNKREPACLPDLFFKMSESLKKKKKKNQWPAFRLSWVMSFAESEWRTAISAISMVSFNGEREK